MSRGLVVGVVDLDGPRRYRPGNAAADPAGDRLRVHQRCDRHPRRPGNHLSYTDSGVVQGATYYYRVRAENQASNSAWSNTASILVPQPVSAAPATLTTRAYARSCSAGLNSAPMRTTSARSSTSRSRQRGSAPPGAGTAV
jgi:hypothetical protein